MGELAQWSCHKIVRAGEIIGVIGQTEPGHGQFVLHVIDCHGQRTPAQLPIARVMASGKIPMAGDFFVVYRDGYTSWSPRQEFLDGYSPLEQHEASGSADSGHGAAASDQQG
ncbi:MAG TPA: hypothetical protein VF748_14650 [Candidatus Acidoferrum sp.]